jgi:hypothetical protein
MVTKFTLGADPEFILTKDEQVCSAIGLIPGSKEAPFTLSNGAGLQTDNVAIEFATPVANTVAEFIDSIHVTLGLIANDLPEGYGIRSMPSAIFPDKELEHPLAQEFGCSPDYNAYTGQMNPRPEAKDKNLRSFGGHVHIGCKSPEVSKFLLDAKGKVLTVKMCDVFLGIPSLLIDNSPESQARRELYGKAGCYRPKSYGVEYRVLSNFWTGSKELVAWVYHSVNDLLDCIEDGQAEPLIKAITPNVIQYIINNNNTEAAEQVVDLITPVLSETTNNLYLDAVLKANERG